MYKSKLIYVLKKYWSLLLIVVLFFMANFLLLFDLSGFKILSATFFCLLILLLYFQCLQIVFLFSEEGKQIVKEDELSKKYLSLLLFGLGFIFIQIMKERFVYYWDYGGYWAMTISQSRYMFMDPINALNSLYFSLNLDDYTLLIPTLMALPMKILGESYISYIMIIFILFGCPAIFFLSIASKIYLQSFHKCNVPFFIPLTVIFLFQIILCPVLNGYPDISGLLMLSALMIISLQFDWKKYDLKKCILIAVILIIILLQRRYYAFAVVGYVAGIAIHAFVSYLNVSKKDKMNIIKTFILTILSIGAVSLLILLLFFKDFLIRGLTNNFSIAYSVYSGGDVFYNLRTVLLSIGSFIVIIILLGIVLTLVKTKLKTPDTFMLITNIIVPLVLFFRIQSLGEQHYYIIACPLAIFLVSGVIQIAEFAKKKIAKNFIFGCIILIFGLNFLNSFSLLQVNSLIESNLFSNIHYNVRVRYDLQELRKIDTDIRKLLVNHESKVYVIGSSMILNDDILRKLNYPDSYGTFDYLSSVSHVDLRDGFSTDFLNADYVLVGNPPQTHLDPSGQQVTILLAQEFIEKKKISGHYKLISQYNLDNEVVANLYQKVEPFTQDDIEYLIQLFDEIYFEYPDLFRERLEKYIVE